MYLLALLADNVITFGLQIYRITFLKPHLAINNIPIIPKILFWFLDLFTSIVLKSLIYLYIFFSLDRLQALQQQMVGGEEATNEEIKERHKKKKKHVEERKRKLAGM